MEKKLVTVHKEKSVRQKGCNVKQEKQDRRSQRTRRLVTNAMMELLREKRYEEITVRDILERAGIGSSTFYAHYFDKEDVQASLIKQLFEQQLQQLLRKSGKREVIPSLELFQHVQQFQALLPGRSEEALWKVIENTLSQMIEESLIDVSGSKHCRSVPQPIVAHFLAGSFLTLLKWWLLSDIRYSPEQMNEFFQQLARPDTWGGR